LKFVVPLGLGIATGLGGLASLMAYLLKNQLSLTFATFSGMILASSLLVARRIPKWNLQHVGILIAGIVIALRIVTLPALQKPPDTLWYMFLCGTIGITAMILPGISGAFILLLLGRYHDIMDSIKGIVHGEISVTVILSLSVFAAGCLTGLLGFSRVLRWLLDKYHDSTMALLCGFMIGSLHKLWPFQRDMTPQEPKFKYKEFEHFFPSELSAQVVMAAVLCLVGIGVVLLLDTVAVKGEKKVVA
jgi:putative membrane protein